MTEVLTKLAAGGLHWCFRHEVMRYRGGYRFVRILQAISREFERFPVEVDGLSPVYINLRQATRQEIVIFTGAPYEMHLQRLFRVLVRPTDTVLDVGANVGIHTVLLDKLAQRVYAFEPNPALWPNLRLTVSGLRNTVLHECALGDVTGSCELVVPEDHTRAHLGTGGGPIPVRRLDDLVETPVQFMKVDVEGFEAAVFRGAEELLNREEAPVIVFEELEQSDAARRVLSSYARARYTFWVAERDGRVRRHDGHTGDWCDILAVPAEAEARVGGQLGREPDAPGRRNV